MASSVDLTLGNEEFSLNCVSIYLNRDHVVIRFSA